MGCHGYALHCIALGLQSTLHWTNWPPKGTHPAAGHFTSLGTRCFSASFVLYVDISAESWKKGAYGVVNGFLAEPLKQSVVNVIGGGDQEWAVVELEANATCKNGKIDDWLPYLSSASPDRSLNCQV